MSGSGALHKSVSPRAERQQRVAAKRPIFELKVRPIDLLHCMLTERSRSRQAVYQRFLQQDDPVLGSITLWDGEKCLAVKKSARWIGFLGEEGECFSSQSQSCVSGIAEVFMVCFLNVGDGSAQVEDGYILAVQLCMATEQGIIKQFGGVPCYYSLITKLHALPTAEPKAHIVPSDSPNHGSQASSDLHGIG